MTKKKILAIIAVVFLVIAIPLTVMVSQQQQDVRQRASENETSFYFSTTDENTPVTQISAERNQQITVHLYLDTKGKTLSAFDVSVDIGSVFDFAGISSFQEGDGAAQFPTEVIKEYNQTTNTIRFSKLSTETTRVITGKLKIGSMTFSTTREGSGIVRVTSAMVVDPTNTTAPLTVDKPSVSYTISETTGQPTATPSATVSPSLTPSPSVSPSASPSPTNTPVPPTNTPTPIAGTATPTLTPSPTRTPTPTPATPMPTLNPRAPTPVSVVPNSGSKPVNQPTYFTTKFSDTAGFANIEKALFLISVNGSGRNDFYGYYNHSSNKVYLRNKDNTDWLGGYALTTANSISNDYFKLHVNNTNTTNSSGNNLVVNWYIEPLSLANNKTYKLFIRGLDKNNDDSGWIQKGTWTVGAVPTLPPGGQLKLSLSLKLQGIGDDIQIVDRDGRPFTLPSNKTPLHTTRQAKVELYNLSDQKVGEATGSLAYNSTEKAFKGDVSVTNSGNSQVYAKVKVDKYLRKRVPGIIDANASVGSNGVNLPSVTLIVADINNDNKIDAFDYNIYTSCFGDKANDPSSCRDKTTVDLYDNGRIDGRGYQMNYLLLLNSFSVREGD